MSTTMRKYSDDDVRRMLAKRIAESNQKTVAAELGVLPSVLCDTLKGRREPGPMLVASLGLRRVVSYVPN